MQSRIDRLEGLVLSLMTSGAPPAGPAVAGSALATDDGSRSADIDHDPAEEDGMAKDEQGEDESDVDRVTNSLGIMKVEANKSLYFGDSHWATILSDIAEVRNYFMENKKQYEEQFQKLAAKKKEDDQREPGFFFSTDVRPDREEIFAALPARPVVDRILSRYFNSCDPAIHILHVPTFQEEYEAHWTNPSETALAWLGLLYAMMTMAMQSYHRAGDEPSEYQGRCLQLANSYRNRTVECLVLADICKPASPMIEAFMLHLYGEFMRNAELQSWVMGGMIVRLAMRMGYHRDPNPFPNITPFQGELRRRVWTFVRLVDLLLSFQIGLPSMIRSADCDTALPRNLYDEEISRHTAVLPPSRPSTEPTPLSYMLTKAQLAFIFGDITEQVSSLCASSYDDVIALDERLRDAHAAIPPHLRLKTMEQSRMDPANLIMQRFNLELLYLKSLCLLHKKFLLRARSHPRYEHSRQACMDASLALMRHQTTLHRETLPQGRLHSVKWFVTSLTSHDFLIAAMIVCLDLYHRSEVEPSPHELPWALERRVEMMQALEKSNAIFAELRDQSMEAWKGNLNLTIMLGTLKQKCPRAAASLAAEALTQVGSFALSSRAAAPEPLPAMGDADDSKPEHSAAMTLGMLSSGGISSSASPSAFDRRIPSPSGRNEVMSDLPGMLLGYPNEPTPGGVSGASPSSNLLGPLAGSEMLEMPMTFDWDTWESYIQGTSLIDPANPLWPLNLDMALTTSADGPGLPADMERDPARGFSPQATVPAPGPGPAPASAPPPSLSSAPAPSGLGFPGAAPTYVMQVNGSMHASDGGGTVPL
ncbi:MAG: hypothetical protein M1826_002385 [Phylliscum demangeonii]|nr:MAG: hypothetical protein M1826_002385 [Phylliscum demangeonii]